MSDAGDYDIQAVDLTDDEYTVEQSLIRKRYVARDAAGNAVLRGKQKMLKFKEEFPFTDADGTDAFVVKAAGFLDVAGNYVLTDATSDEDLVVLDNDYSILQDTWTLRDADSGAEVASIASRGALTTLVRAYLPLGFLIPYRYEITDADGAHVGTIAGKIALRDRYEITIDDASTVPKEAVVAAAMVIDAIQDR